jgi:hypothetical protein
MLQLGADFRVKRRRRIGHVVETTSTDQDARPVVASDWVGCPQFRKSGDGFRVESLRTGDCHPHSEADCHCTAGTAEPRWQSGARCWGNITCDSRRACSRNSANRLWWNGQIWGYLACQRWCCRRFFRSIGATHGERSGIGRRQQVDSPIPAKVDTTAQVVVDICAVGASRLPSVFQEC